MITEQDVVEQKAIRLLDKQCNSHVQEGTIVLCYSESSLPLLVNRTTIYKITADILTLPTFASSYFNTMPPTSIAARLSLKFKEEFCDRISSDRISCDSSADHANISKITATLHDDVENEAICDIHAFLLDNLNLRIMGRGQLKSECASNSASPHHSVDLNKVAGYLLTSSFSTDRRICIMDAKLILYTEDIYLDSNHRGQGFSLLALDLLLRKLRMTRNSLVLMQKKRMLSFSTSSDSSDDGESTGDETTADKTAADETTEGATTKGATTKGATNEDETTEGETIDDEVVGEVDQGWRRMRFSCWAEGEGHDHGFQCLWTSHKAHIASVAAQLFEKDEPEPASRTVVALRYLRSLITSLVLALLGVDHST